MKIEKNELSRRFKHIKMYELMQNLMHKILHSDDRFTHKYNVTNSCGYIFMILNRYEFDDKSIGLKAVEKFVKSDKETSYNEILDWMLGDDRIEFNIAYFKNNCYWPKESEFIDTLANYYCTRFNKYTTKYEIFDVIDHICQLTQCYIYAKEFVKNPDVIVEICDSSNNYCIEFVKKILKAHL